VCRLLPPTLRISVSPLEKTDAQIQVARVGFVPTRDTGGFNVGFNFRPVSVIDPRRDQRQVSHHSRHFRLNSYWQLSQHIAIVAKAIN
jgi:hypothetical protein